MGVEIKVPKALTKKLTEMEKLEGAKKIVKYHTAQLQKKAQNKAPVDTRFLKRSITLEIQDNGLTGRVYAYADYAYYQEKGTRFMPAQPYMEPSLNEVKPQFLDDLKELKGR